MLTGRGLLVAFIIQAFVLAKGLALAELQISLLPSFQVFNQADFVFSSDTTLLFGDGFLSAGPYYAFESLSQNVIDQSFGGAIRFGRETYFEIDSGYFERRFLQRQTHLNGRGYSASLGVGHQFGDHIGVALNLTAKRIQSGDLDKRTIVDLLPFVTLREAF